VRKHADAYGFDWRLIAAMMQQESRFDPKAVSFAGARGLLQVMPRTAAEFGGGDLADPEEGILTGLRYLAWLRTRFDETLPATERNWFMLAAYNAGQGHVIDARALARQHGLDPNRWFGHVEQAMLLKRRRDVAAATRFGYCRCDEPVRYVRAVRDRYRAYVEVAANTGTSG
jgi:membrane-bound lytic murein transglycosylase F